MQTTIVKIDGITYEYGDECGEGQDFCIWQIAPDGSGRKRKQMCIKHHEEVMAEAAQPLLVDANDPEHGIMSFLLAQQQETRALYEGLTPEQEDQILEGYRTQHEGCCDHDEPH